MKKSLVLTVDLEWFYNGDGRGDLSAFSKMSSEDRFRYCGSGVAKSVNQLLGVLEEHDQRVTFFTLAELDLFYPEVVEAIYERGHEVALHSFRHDDLNRVESGDAELERCLPFRDKYGVVSFRAPNISIPKSFYPLLRRHGYRFDSSVYGTTAFEHDGVRVYPVSVLPYGGEVVNAIPCRLDAALIRRAVPFGSGLFTGALHALTPWFVDRFWRRYEQPPCLFIHSWQIAQPYCPSISKVRHPWMLPYSIELRGVLKTLCRRYQLVRLKDYFA